VEVYNTWVDWAAAQRELAKSASYQLASGQTNAMFDTMFATDKIGTFHYFHLQKFMTSECISGIILSLLIAFVILCFATHNLYMSIFSVTTIAIIVCSVVAFAVWQGWKLGVVEAIIFVMVVGMSVDYVIHLSDAYVECKATKRGPRTQEMLTKMGVSIVSGALSTIGMSFFLGFFTFVTFFSKIGLIMFFMIWMAMIFSLVGLSAFLDLVGPEDEHGKIEIARTVTNMFHRISSSIVGNKQAPSTTELLNEIKTLKAALLEEGNNRKTDTDKLLSEVDAMRREARGAPPSLPKVESKVA